ncbi:MAG: hypothetical protein ACK4EY_15085 [Flavipsychrobacter sp.]
MQSIVTVDNQSLLNLALQLYGNEDATDELLQLNDFTGNILMPGYIDAAEVDLAYSVKPGVTVFYDETSVMINKKALKELHGDKWQTRDGMVIADGLRASDFKIFNKVFNNVFG